MDEGKDWTLIVQPHWFENKAMQIRLAGRRPNGVREWLRCAWNADIFYGPVPFLKTLAVVSLAISYLGTKL